MKVTDMWKKGSGATVSFELFPARSPKATDNLEKELEVLAQLKPDFVSVTFGAGGCTREGSLQLVEKLKQEKGLEVMAYIAGYGLSPANIIAVLDGYRERKVENVLVVRGDRPREEGFEPHPDSLSHASELMALLRPRYDFCMGVAGYPEGHIEAVSKDKDLDYLKLKADLGAEFIIANYFYDNRFFFDFVERCQTAGITIPILPGVMPIYSIKMMETLAGICGATITKDLRRGIAELKEGDKEGLLAFGIEFAKNQCVQLLEAGMPGIHVYTLNHSESAVGLVERLRSKGLLPKKKER